MKTSLGIRKYDYVEFYVGSAKMVAYWYAKALGMEIAAYKGPETGHRDRCSYLLKLNDLKIVITSALQPETVDVYSFLQKHGDGVKRWSMEVDDVETACSYMLENGGIPVQTTTKIEEKGKGFVTTASFRVYDDTEIQLVNRDNFEGNFLPGFSDPVQKLNLEFEPTGLLRIDHIVGNVRVNEMDKWVDYMNSIMDFETFVDFGPGDISTKYSALLSKVVRSKDNSIKNPVNEPFEGLRMSQIEEYIKEYKGSGIQHIAVETECILTAIRALRANGVEFLQVPSTYYEQMREAKPAIEESIDELEELGILMDFEGDGYLLQLFTKPIGDRPTFFFEFIQRKGKSEGFGQGNFQALFEAIELDQEKRGNLV